ncbi:hypothetical protein GQ600_2696 [Phytophthora cactorum]|nr:hypothetical protein GQ600_2696 [Phytophthora cactorum]
MTTYEVCKPADTTGAKINPGSCQIQHGWTRAAASRGLSALFVIVHFTRCCTKATSTLPDLQTRRRALPTTAARSSAQSTKRD